MARKAEKPVCTEDELAILKDWSASKTMERRLVERAQLVLKSVSGETDNVISKILNLDVNTVGKWRKRFISKRIDGLFDNMRSGKPRTYDIETTRNSIFNVLEKPPPKGQATWDGKAIAAEPGISDDRRARYFR
jgi:transposase